MNTTPPTNIAKLSPQALVLLNGVHCGALFQAENGRWVFIYDDAYRAKHVVPLSLSLPLSKAEHWTKTTTLHPFFLNLLPEGWLLAVARELKVDVSTSIAVLTAMCRDNIGAAEIYPAGEPVQPTKPAEIPAHKKVESEDDKVRVHSRCLFCHEFLPSPGHNRNYHEPCAEKLFGAEQPPILSFRSKDVRAIASLQLGSGHAVTGVQQKLSGILRSERNTIVLPGRFILKPQPSDPFYADMVLLELAMMHFAQFLQLRCAPTGLLYARDGIPSLLSRRFDRTDSQKIHCEDFAQALGVEPGNKYGGTLERAADLISGLQSSKNALDADKRAFIEVCLFNFLLGNADNHLKNFSIAHFQVEGKLISRLAPFYDLVPARLFPSGDTEETGLSLFGKKRRLKLKHFYNLADRMEVSTATVDEFVVRFKKAIPMLKTITESVFVPELKTNELLEYINYRLEDLARS